MVSINKIQHFTQLKNNTVWAAYSGNYKLYKNSLKQYASAAIKDYDTARTAPSMQVKNVPLFSKAGLNMLKCWFLDKFRIKTPDEKQYKKMTNTFKLQKEFEKYTR